MQTRPETESKFGDRRWTKIQPLDWTARSCHQVAVGGAGRKPEGGFLRGKVQARGFHASEPHVRARTSQASCRSDISAERTFQSHALFGNRSRQRENCRYHAIERERQASFIFPYSSCILNPCPNSFSLWMTNPR